MVTATTIPIISLLKQIWIEERLRIDSGHRIFALAIFNHFVKFLEILHKFKLIQIVLNLHNGLLGRHLILAANSFQNLLLFTIDLTALCSNIRVL